MKIDHYINDCFSIVDGTLLSCRNESRRLVIPASVNGHAIRRIGSGCGILAGTHTVIVSEGIREIGQEAFINCPHIKRLELPESLERIGKLGGLGMRWKSTDDVELKLYIRRSFSHDDHKRLLNESLQMPSGEYLLNGDYVELPQFLHVLDSFGSLRLPACLSPKMGIIYTELKGKVCRLCDGGSEDDAGEMEHRNFVEHIVPELIQTKRSRFWDDASELAADMAMRRYEETVPETVILTFFRKEETQIKNGRYIVRFCIAFRKAFIPVVCKVCHEGRTAYVYNEMYLSPDSKRAFLRYSDPSMVFGPDGKYIRQKEFYEKYKLLAMFS